MRTGRRDFAKQLVPADEQHGVSGLDAGGPQDLRIGVTDVALDRHGPDPQQQSGCAAEQRKTQKEAGKDGRKRRGAASGTAIAAGAAQTAVTAELILYGKGGRAVLPHTFPCGSPVCLHARAAARISFIGHGHVLLSSFSVKPFTAKII